MWEHLRNKKLLGYKFRRQFSVDYYVLDFYCPKKKLGIELDGKIHDRNDVKNRDDNRGVFLNQFGIKVLRIKNEEIMNDISAVLVKIKIGLLK